MAEIHCWSKQNQKKAIFADTNWTVIKSAREAFISPENLWEVPKLFDLNSSCLVAAASECWSVGRGTSLTDQRNSCAVLLAKTAQGQLGNNSLNVLEWSPDLPWLAQMCNAGSITRRQEAVTAVTGAPTTQERLWMGRLMQDLDGLAFILTC